MKKFSLFLFFFFTVNGSIFSQDNFESGAEIGVYGGITIPLGDFAGKDLNDWNDHCGCANTAGALAIQLKVRVKNNLWGFFWVQGAWNYYDPEPLANALYNDFNIPINIETNGWRSKIFKLGAAYNFNLDEIWAISIETSGLLNSLSSYSFRTKSPDGSNRYPLLQKSVDDTGIGYSLGAAISANWDGLGLRLTADYITSSHNIEKADRRFNGGDLIPQNYDQRLNMLLVQVGIILNTY